jgi:mannose-1-phosphate guanylyltransferase
MKQPKIFILAGGSGKRLFPLSTINVPKQFLKIASSYSFLQKTILRLLNICSATNIIIIGSENHRDCLIGQVKELGLENKIHLYYEKKSYNTARALFWGLDQALKEKILNYDDTVIVSPSDHAFSDDLLFINQLKEALCLYDQTNILCFSIKPSTTNSNFGYIKYRFNETSKIKKVIGFIEKPCKSICKRIFNESWEYNTGIYVFSYMSILSEAITHCPEIFDLIFCKKGDNTYCLSIDQALIQKTKKLHVYQLNQIEWIDIGSWENLERYLLEFNQSKIQNTLLFQEQTVNS